MTDEEIEILIEKRIKAALKRVVEKISRTPLGWGIRGILKQISDAIDD